MRERKVPKGVDTHPAAGGLGGLGVGHPQGFELSGGLELADVSPDIQGYTDGVFWERNTLADQKNGHITEIPKRTATGLFDDIKTYK